VAACLPNLLGVGIDCDRLCDRIGTTCLQGPLTCYLDQTHAANAGDAQVVVVAESRYVDAKSAGSIQDRRAQGTFTSWPSMVMATISLAAPIAVDVAIT